MKLKCNLHLKLDAIAALIFSAILSMFHNLPSFASGVIIVRRISPPYLANLLVQPLETSKQRTFVSEIIKT